MSIENNGSERPPRNSGEVPPADVPDIEPYQQSAEDRAGAEEARQRLRNNAPLSGGSNTSNEAPAQNNARTGVVEHAHHDSKLVSGMKTAGSIGFYILELIGHAFMNAPWGDLFKIKGGGGGGHAKKDDHGHGGGGHGGGHH